jgi:hypothetical protein
VKRDRKYGLFGILFVCLIIVVACSKTEEKPIKELTYLSQTVVEPTKENRALFIAESESQQGLVTEGLTAIADAIEQLGAGKLSNHRYLSIVQDSA